MICSSCSSKLWIKLSLVNPLGNGRADFFLCLVVITVDKDVIIDYNDVLEAVS